MTMRLPAAIALLSLLASCLPLSCSGARKVTEYGLRVVGEHPHDEASFTQGLFFEGGVMFESTGQWGESTFRQVDMATGEAKRKLKFDRKYFVEGSVMLGGKLYILTWTDRVAFIYDAATLEYQKTVSYPHDGWGLTTDGKRLIASDGSSNLYFLDADLRQTGRVGVTMNGRPLRNLNELEWVDGKVWANVYLTDMIVIIDPDSGEVEASIDCRGLLPDRLRDERTDVLNGIAYDKATGKIYLTGKYWKRLYEVELVGKKGGK